ncbi:coiled-coil domain-containing protein [Hymenobacter siberiensis]|uniref:hypothetical protein n=1 Tax=Hymenobacter siberiensis TaxID=2848396 RepID=UPI001C1E5C45|nr:hypothetical protein [Hymenobacter siberiensis]
MATNTKILTLSINGVDTAIKNVTQLKATVAQLEQELHGADFGSEQFDKLTAELNASRKALDGVQDAVKKAGQGADAAGANAKKMGGDFKGAFGIASLAAGDTGAALGRLEGGFSSVKGGLDVVKGGFGSLKAAIASTGIGLLLIAFGFLVTYFTKSQEGMDFLSRKTAALQAVFQVLTTKAIAIGKAIFEAFSNPKKSLQDLVSFIETNLLNRLKAFSVVLDGIVNKDLGKITNGFIQMGTGIENATTKAKAFADNIAGLGKEIQAAAVAGEKLAVSNQNIAREESKLNVERANSRARIAELKLITDDATKSLKVRTEAAKTSFEIEQGLSVKQLNLQNQQITNLKAAQKIKGQYTNEDRQALAELLTKRAETQKESLEKQAELTAKLSGFTQQQLAADQAAIAKKAATETKAATITKALREKALADNTAAHVVEGEIQKKAIEIELAAAVKGSDQQLTLLRRQKVEELNITLQAIDDKIKKAGPKEAEALLKQRTAAEKDGNVAFLKISADFEKERLAAATQGEADLAQVKVLGLEEGTKAYIQALLDQVTAQMFVELSSLENTKENEAKRTLIIADAAKKRGEIIKAASKPADLETDILKSLFGLTGDQLEATKRGISDTMNYAAEALFTLLDQAAQARTKALDAQQKEVEDAMTAAQDASDLLRSQLDESQGRIDELEGKLLTTRGEQRQRIIDQLAIERKRLQEIAAEKKKEDDRIKKAEQDKLAIEKQRTAEADKRAKVQAQMNALTAVASALEATYAAYASIRAIAKAGAEGKFGYDNIALILAATAGIVAAGVAVKGAVKFAEGGYTGNGNGTPDDTGFKVAGVVHEGEYVLPKWMVTSPKFSSTIAQLESARVNNGLGYATGGMVTAPAAGNGSGPDMSVLISMQQQLNTLQLQTAVALEKPITVRPSDIANYQAERVFINDLFIN